MTEENRFPSQLAERFQIRLPDGMRDRLKSEAEKNGRSMNAEIIQRLQSTLDFDDHIARFPNIGSTDEAQYGLDYADHLKANPTPGLPILDAIGKMLTEIDSLKSMLVGVRVRENGVVEPILEDREQSAKRARASEERKANPKPEDWDWDSLPKDNVGQVKKPERQSKAKKAS